MREYSYRCHDFSLLTPGFKKRFVAPLLPFVPWVIPANIITIISNVFVYLGFFVSLYFHSPMSRLVVAVLLFLYLVGDHLDGMQAKRTKTGSALGEFCDHYLDAFNNGIILFTAFLVLNIHNPVVVAVVLTTSYLAHMSVFYEQFKTGWLTFEKLGSLEAVLLTSFIVGFSSIDIVFVTLTAPAFMGFSWIELIFLASALGAISTFLTTIKRTPGRGAEVWLFVAGIILMTATSYSIFTSMELFVLITLYASYYIGVVMRGHLVDGIERLPDLVLPISVLLFSLFDYPSYGLFWLLSIYIFIRICVLVVQTFSILKVFWVWSNPRA
ncbi:MAG: CDP-alcohol phosphatidyltransferase family protein [Cyclobacteriaceae bacterium]|nr:CDP-alcohol phosphatidyltransferase family protein [Cyclobacteriaceae bacterium]